MLCSPLAVQPSLFVQFFVINCWEMWIRKGVNETENSDAKLDEISQHRARLTFIFFYNEPNLLLLILIQLLSKAKQGTVHHRVLWTRRGRLRYQLRTEAVKRKQIIILCSVLISQYVYVIIFAKYVCHTRFGRGAPFTPGPPEISWFLLTKFNLEGEAKGDRRECVQSLA